MGRMALTRTWHPIDRRDAHPPHQGGHMAPSDAMPLASEDIPEHPGSGERILQRQFVNPAHERERGVGDRPRLVVRCRAGELQHLTLSRHW